MAANKHSPQDKNSSLILKILIEKHQVLRGIEPGSPDPKSAMLAPRPKIDEKCLKNQKNFGYMFSNSKFFEFLIMNYETHSSQMCRRLEIILS